MAEEHGESPEVVVSSPLREAVAVFVRRVLNSSLGFRVPQGAVPIDSTVGNVVRQATGRDPNQFEEAIGEVREQLANAS